MLKDIEKDFLIRTLLYFANSEILEKVKALLPVQYEKMMKQYWY